MSGPRRKLSAVDDPLALGAERPAPPSTPAVPAAPAPTPPVAPSSRELPALFVRVPQTEFDALARAAFELGVHKRELVAALLWRYIRPATPDGLAAVRQLVREHRGVEGG
ncbi:MAG TPA: hypothetical protein VN238_20445 [Solirubrobacteraceae bacterium]|nr:hypothetical protein [Solirubrobacteraceae bacterium]